MELEKKLELLLYPSKCALSTDEESVEMSKKAGKVKRRFPEKPTDYDRLLEEISKYVIDFFLIGILSAVYIVVQFYSLHTIIVKYVYIIFSLALTLHRKIKQNEATNNLRVPLVFPAPGGNWRKLLIQGEGLKAVEPQILKLITDRYPSYDITVSDIPPVFRTEDTLPVYTELYGETPFEFYLIMNRGFNVRSEDSSIATIGGFLCDDNDERCFVFTAAHSLVSGQDMEGVSGLFAQPQDMKKHVEKLRANLFAKHSSDQLLLHSHNFSTKISGACDFLFAAQEYVKMDEAVQDYRKFKMDLILLQVSPMKVYSNPVQKVPYTYINQFEGK